MERSRPRRLADTDAVSLDDDLLLHGGALGTDAAGGDSRPDETVSEPEAQRVWQVAARLQAEAARRLDARSEQIARDHPAAPRGAVARFSRAEVDEIAEAAGIDPAFVALAWREVDAEAVRHRPISDVRHRRASAFLGTDAERLSMTRTFQASPEAVLESMQRVFPADPFRLSLIEILGEANALTDAALLFDVPQISVQTTETGGDTAFSYAMSLADLTRAVVTLHPLGENQTEATVTVDLRHGKVRNMVFGGWFTGIAAAVAGAIGYALGDGGVTAALGAGLGSTGVGGLTYLGYRSAYAGGLRKGEKALDSLLGAVGVDLRSGGAFARSASVRPSARTP